MNFNNNWTTKNIMLINKKIDFHEKVFEELNLGELLSLLDLISIYSTNKKLTFSGTFYNFKNSLKINQFDFGNDFVGVSKYSELKNYEEFLFLGFNPRFDSSLLNICFARLKENNDIKFSSIGPAFENFFSVKHQGNHGKSFLNILEGRSIKNYSQRFERFTKIFYGLGLTSILSKTSVISNFLNSKYYENPLFISSEMGLLHYLEIFRGSYIQNFLQEESFEKTLTQKLQYNFDIQFPKKNLTKVIDKYDFEVHESNFDYKNVSQINIKFPLNSFYEQSSWALNIFGDIQSTQQSMNILVSKANTISEWLLSVSTLALDWSRYFNKLFIRGKKSKKRIAVYNFLKDFKNPFIYNNLFTYNIFWSLYNTNKQEIAHKFKKISFKDYSLIKMQNAPFEVNIYNFYTSSKLSRYSTTMVKLSYIYPSHCLLK